MSPARLSSIEDMSEFELCFEGIWSAQPNKKQKMLPNEQNVDIFDDIETLWETKWKSACKRRQAPFQDASYLDFAPLFASLIQRGITTARSPLYTQALLTTASALADDAHITARSNPDLASQMLLRACALLRVARYPSAEKQQQHPSCYPTLQQHALALQKDLHARAARLWDTDSPLDEVLIPHVHDGATHPDLGPAQHRSSNNRRPHIPALVRVPLETLLTGRACPAVVIVSGSDRMGCTEACERLLARGWAVVVVEAPGCGECPVREGGAKGEGEAALWTSVLGWMAAMGFYDMENVVVVGDGDAVLRVAVTVGDRLRGVVAYLDGEVSVVDEDKDKEEEEEEEEAEAAAVVLAAGMDETQSPALCPSLIVSERSPGLATANGLWTPVKDDEEEEAASQHDDEGYHDLYAFGTEHTACISQLHTTGRNQVYAWIGDLMAGRSGGYFWTVVPAPEKVAGAMSGGRRPFERELTPPFA